MKFKLNMRLISLCLAFILALASFLSCAGKGSSNGSDGTQKENSKPNLPELDRYDISKAFEESMVKVISYDYDGKTELSIGTGFFVDGKGMFITNAHVIKDAYYVKIKNHTGKFYNVDIMYIFNEIDSDYAVCRASECYVSTPVKFATSANEGDNVYAIGFPQDSYESSISPGKITNANTILGGKAYYTNTAWIDHGSSGGVLCDAWGRVLGITTGVRPNGDYVALKYEEFKDDIEKKHTGGKEPLKYFHTVREYEFNPSTMLNYFDILINLPSYTDTNMDYEITVRLKDKYENTDMLLKTMSTVVISVKLETKYEYSNADGSSPNSETTTDTLYFEFKTIEELKNGKTQLSHSVYSGEVEGLEYNMDIAYEASFGVMQSGKIVIYN